MKTILKNPWLAGALLVVAMLLRFIAISQQFTIDLSVYLEVLTKYLATPSRTKIFLIQFLPIFFCLIFLIKSKSSEAPAFIYAALIFTIVSFGRYIHPTVNVSIFGDVITIIIFQSIKKSQPWAALALVLCMFIIMLRFWLVIPPWA